MAYEPCCMTSHSHLESTPYYLLSKCALSWYHTAPRKEFVVKDAGIAAKIL